ncbi:hypothetical protein SDC9_76778 [bioreactor metagenome]|uniref:Uncharacterized protein n=1 Tax=bioreactor metagenome TaxID=1076179 RepID=A0A644YP45_9ZZZZ
MAKFETSGIDELIDELESLSSVIPEYECPECGKEFDLPLDADSVTCPHCGTTFKIKH